MSTDERDDDGEDRHAVPSSASDFSGADDSSTGQLKGAGGVGDRADPDDAGSTEADQAPEASDPGDRARGAEVDEAAETQEGELVEDQDIRRLSNVVASAIELTSESFSGLLPHPDHWERYSPEWQERYARMSEAYTTDESKRRDKVVDAQIKEVGRSRRAALSVIYGSFGGSLLALGLFDNTVVAVAFLATGVMQAAREFIRSPRTGRSEQSQLNKDKDDQRAIEGKDNENEQ